MNPQRQWKKKAAKEAAGLVKDEMIVGLGSGTTVAESVKILKESGSKAEFVVSSVAIQKLAQKSDLTLTSLEKNPKLDMVIDGADEVNPNLDMIKGGGGAHTREKIVANAGEKVIIIVDKTKLVKHLGGKNPVPVEIIPFAHEHIAKLLKKLGTKPQLRKSPSGELFVTDNGNYILDLEVNNIDNPTDFEKKINQIPGVIENGIFTNLIDKLCVGHERGCEIIESKEDFQKTYETLNTSN